MTEPLPYFRILAALCEPWAITEPVLDRMVQAVLDPDHMTVDALAAKIGRPLDNTGHRVEQRGATAILGIAGPIFRYSNLFTAISGATSTELAAQDLETALSSGLVDNIVLNINSPGGEVDGTNAFAAMVRDGAKRKPIYAYIDGLGASAAYWIASAATEVIAEESAWVGSIGVTATLMDRSGAQERQGVKSYQIVSSQSPRKNPSPATETGRAQLQERVDTIAQMFIDRVAKYRGVSPETVQSDFGQGNVFPAQLAKKRGMIDRVQGFESFLAGLTDSRSMVSMAATAAEERTMADQPAAPAQQPTAAASAPPLVITATPQPLTFVTQSPMQTGYVVNTAPQPAPPDTAAAERAGRTRCQTILTNPEAASRRELAEYLAFETDYPVEQCAMILKTSPKAAQPGAHGGPLAAAMAQVANPRVAALGAAGDTDTSDAAEVQRVLAFVPKQYKVGAH